MYIFITCVIIAAIIGGVWIGWRFNDRRSSKLLNELRGRIDSITDINREIKQTNSELERKSEDFRKSNSERERTIQEFRETIVKRERIIEQREETIEELNRKLDKREEIINSIESTVEQLESTNFRTGTGIRKALEIIEIIREILLNIKNIDIR